MFIEDSLLSYGEKLVLKLKELYSSRGYLPYRMSRFEEYDFYAENKDFLLSDRVMTFTDTNGKLMAMRPDVTLSIIRNSKDLPNTLRKLYYHENVYRSGRGSGTFREIPQTGLECLGSVTAEDTAGVILLAAESLSVISDRFVIALSDLSVLEDCLGLPEFSGTARPDLLKAVQEKNCGEVQRLFRDYNVSPEKEKILITLMNLSGKLSEACPVLERLYSEVRNLRDSTFPGLLKQLSQSSFSENFRFDISVTADMNYYNGVIFKGYTDGIPEAVLSGGRYDRLMRKMKRTSRAVGFAVYTGLIESNESRKTGPGSFLNIALPKGRLGESVYRLFENAGFGCPGILEDRRKLVFENPEKGVRYFWVKPMDVPVYVERGTADIGAAGQDVLSELEPVVYNILDLETGICKMAEAVPEDYREDLSAPLRVATKYPGIAGHYYRLQGREIDIIKLNGSIEAAPVLGLSDVIVDIVETGKTLRENHLHIKEIIMPVSARLIVNESSFAFREERIRDLAGRLAEAVRGKK